MTEELELPSVGDTAEGLPLPEGWEFRKNLNQLAIERFELEMDKETFPPRTSFAAKGRLNANWTRSAIRAELFNERTLGADEVSSPDTDPSMVAQVALAVSAWYYEKTRPPEKK
jgi:hypothetical protein